MLKLALIGGLLVALSIGGLSLGEIFFGLIGLGAALLVLAVAISMVAEMYKWAGRRNDSVFHGGSVRMQRSR